MYTNVIGFETEKKYSHLYSPIIQVQGHRYNLYNENTIIVTRNDGTFIEKFNIVTDETKSVYTYKIWYQNNRICVILKYQNVDKKFYETDFFIPEYMYMVITYMIIDGKLIKSKEFNLNLELIYTYTEKETYFDIDEKYYCKKKTIIVDNGIIIYNQNSSKIKNCRKIEYIYEEDTENIEDTLRYCRSIHYTNESDLKIIEAIKVTNIDSDYAQQYHLYFNIIAVLNNKIYFDAFGYGKKNIEIEKIYKGKYTPVYLLNSQYVIEYRMFNFDYEN